jgi:hypothetical protein
MINECINIIPFIEVMFRKGIREDNEERSRSRGET